MRRFLLILFFAIAFCSLTKGEDFTEGYTGVLKRDLYEAIHYANVSAVQSLIERGVELKPPNSSEQPFSFPLHHAIKVVHLAESDGEENRSPRLEIVKLILKSWNGSLEFVNEFNHQTPLYLAVSHALFWMWAFVDPHMNGWNGF